jgi:hypothetical protein
MMLDQDLSRYRLTRAISDEGLLRTCDMLTMPMRVLVPLAEDAAASSANPGYEAHTVEAPNVVPQMQGHWPGRTRSEACGERNSHDALMT